MSGYHGPDGWQDEPMDDRDKGEPSFIIDPVFSGIDGGGEREDRHRGLREDGSYESRTAGEAAAMDVRDVA